MPTLLTMSNLNFEKAAFLWKSYKTQLAVFFISCCFIPVSNALLNGRNLLMVTENFGWLGSLTVLSLSWVSQGKVLWKERKTLVLTFCWSFFVNQVWPFSFIGLITIMKEPCELQNNEPARKILDFVLTRILNKKKLKWSCLVLLYWLSINFALKKAFYVG